MGADELAGDRELEDRTHVGWQPAQVAERGRRVLEAALRRSGLARQDADQLLDHQRRTGAHSGSADEEAVLFDELEQTASLELPARIFDEHELHAGGDVDAGLVQPGHETGHLAVAHRTGIAVEQEQRQGHGGARRAHQPGRGRRAGWAERAADQLGRAQEERPAARHLLERRRVHGQRVVAAGTGYGHRRSSSWLRNSGSLAIASPHSGRPSASR